MKTSEPIVLFQQFAELLSLVLTHPATPAPCRDAFLAALVSYSAPVRELGANPPAALLRVTLLRALAVDLAHAQTGAQPPAATEGEAAFAYLSCLPDSVPAVEGRMQP